MTTPIRPAPKATASPRAATGDALGRSSPDFEANRGQVDPQVQFLMRGPGYTLFLTSTEMVFAIQNPASAPVPGPGATAGKAVALTQTTTPVPETTVVRARFVGGNPGARIVGQEELPGRSNYFRGSDPAGWVTNVPHYGRVTYQGVYPGVDLVFYTNAARQLEYDWVVAPGADPAAIRLTYQGADGLRLDAQGNLIVSTAAGAVTQHAPTLYQEVGGARQAVPGHFTLAGPQDVGVAVGDHDAGRPLVIDPVLSYSTYLGGSFLDQATAVAVDANGCIYVTGKTNSADFPVFNPYQGQNGGGAFDAFVAKLTPDGSQPIYSTYLGGFRADTANAIAVDADGNAYVTGNTQSADFPVMKARFPNLSGTSDAFVTELDPTGATLVFSTFLGGSGAETGTGIALDGSANIYVAGRTSSTNFPRGSITGFQTSFGGGATDAFVAELAAGGSQLVYSTYLGRGGDDEALGIAVDAAGALYLTGDTDAASFPLTPGAFQTRYGGGIDAFVTKIDPTQPPSDQLVYSTFLGGSDLDIANGIAVDSAGEASVTGITASRNFPLDPNALQPSYGGGLLDAFVTRLAADGSGVLYSTYLGGSGDDEGNAITLDRAGNAYITGSTNSPDLPTTEDALQPGLGAPGATNAFVVVIDPLGDQESYASYFGGSRFDQGWGIAADDNGDVYLAGLAVSTDFPTASAFQPQLNGGQNAFVAQQMVLSC